MYPTLSLGDQINLGLKFIRNWIQIIICRPNLICCDKIIPAAQNSIKKFEIDQKRLHVLKFNQKSW